jgi:hypothetical protein
MRDILFRGKLERETSTGECAGDWVYGGFMLGKDGRPYVMEKCGKVLRFHPVVPETVGEYTGLTDKNDSPIFEGQIVKLTAPKHRPQNAAVVFKDGSFMLEMEARGYTFLSGCDSSQLGIIGNVHDNPDLLEKIERETGTSDASTPETVTAETATPGFSTPAIFQRGFSCPGALFLRRLTNSLRLMNLTPLLVPSGMRPAKSLSF